MKKAICIVIILALIFTSACGRGTEKQSVSFFAYDTTISLAFYGQKVSDEFMNECVEYLKSFEPFFSMTDENSELYKLNASGGGEVSDILLDCIKEALEYCKLTNGAFDITLGNTNRLWNVVERKIPPTEAEINSALETVGYEFVDVSGNKIEYKKEGLRIDLGGFAKGYVADRFREFLHQKGIENGVILTMGGAICCVGKKHKADEQYKVGIVNPFDKSSLLNTLKVTDLNVTTSGTSERFFEYENVRYHHIMSPITGAPVQNEIEQVTVICYDAAMGDALSTAFFVLGLENSKALIESQLGEVGAIFAMKNGEIICVNYNLE